MSMIRIGGNLEIKFLTEPGTIGFAFPFFALQLMHWMSLFFDSKYSWMLSAMEAFLFKRSPMDQNG